MRFFRVAIFLSAAVMCGCASISEPGSYFVTDSVVNVRLGPTLNAKVTNRIYRQQRVDVFEVRGGWARVSKYYDGQIEGEPGQVARWVSARRLSVQRPEDLSQPALPTDPRISGLPRVGEGGLSKRDVLILHRGAMHFLKTNRCQRIEFGDKSVSRKNTYYVNCGGPQNLFFTPSEIPKK